MPKDGGGGAALPELATAVALVGEDEDTRDAVPLPAVAGVTEAEAVELVVGLLRADVEAAEPQAAALADRATATNA